MRLHGIMLTQLNTRTTLPLAFTELEQALEIDEINIYINAGFQKTKSTYRFL
jgi:hypothetical protein